jgi:hypothetical protein
MATRINRRGYQEITRLAREVIVNPKQPIARRLRSAAMLMEVFDKNDRAEDRAQARRDALAAAAAAAARPPKPVEMTPVSTSESAIAFLIKAGVTEIEDDD